MPALSFRRTALALAASLVGALMVTSSPAGPAQALDLPTSPVPPSAVPLPSAQIDGIAWEQLVVGNTVYVGGSFSTARPAGAAPGQNTVVRQNLLAFDITTGALLPGFVANTNGQVLGLAMSPDGSRLYVSGLFTSINGTTRNRIAAVNPTTGAVITQFNARTDYLVRSMVVTSDVIYVGGSFGSAGGLPRTNLAAFRASDGAVLNWAPTAGNGQVMAVAMIPGSDKIVVGGAFDNLNGVPLRGLGAVDPVTGATVDYPANLVIRNSGTEGAVYALRFDNQRVYGSGYTYGSAGGNFEGNFAADRSGNIIWLNDIHGDQYDIFPGRGLLFSVGHAHSDFNVLGGIPQQDPSRNWYALTQVNEAGGVVQENTQNRSRYSDFAGQPSTAAVLPWYPEFTAGTVSGSSMAGWSVGGDNRYVVIVGEFTRVNSLNQQGIVRFAYRDAVSTNDPPRLSGANFVPDLTSPAPGTVQVSWPANWDRDNYDLTYWVQREGAGTIGTFNADSTFFNRPILTHLDTGLTPGSTQRYRIVATDPAGGRVYGDYVSVTVSASGSLGQYAPAVLADRPSIYWRLSDEGTDLADSSYTWDGAVTSGVTRGVAGAISGDSNTATRFNGSSQTGWNATVVDTPTELSTEAWFRTTTTTGGMLIGYGSRPSTVSSSTTATYRTYMDNMGRLYFGVLEATRQVISSPQSYNDGQWHHVVSTLDWTGAKLYVDGALVAENPDLKHGEPRSGYWRIGWDTLANWSNRPTSDNFEGDLDEVAIYSAALPAGRVSAHHSVGTGNGPVNVAPVASFMATVAGLGVQVSGTGSTDDGSIESYAWDFGDGNVGSGVSASHIYAAAGTYTVRLTVTDDKGLTGTTTRSVSVAPVNVDPVAAFTSSVSGLDVQVVGSESTDDGSIASYAWDFGDDTSGAGETSSHTYDAAGTYDVTLTVTDDQGATDSVTHPVMVSSGTADVFAQDAFARTVSNGWGSAPVGGAWAVTGSATPYSVDGSVGRMTLTAGSQRQVTLGISRADVDLRAKLGMDKAATGGGMYLSVGARASGNTAYVGRVRFINDGSVQLHLQRSVSGTVTTLTGGTVAGVTAQAGQLLNLRLQVSGSPATIRAKLWAAGDAEPSGWNVTTTDSTTALQAPGGFYIQPYMSASTTNAPVSLLVDDVDVVAVG